MPQGILEEALRAMLEGGPVRDVLVSLHEQKWTLAVRLSGTNSHWMHICSRREALRTWASLTAVGRFAESAGIHAFQVAVDVLATSNGDP